MVCALASAAKIEVEMDGFLGRIFDDIDEWALMTGVHDGVHLYAFLESGDQITEDTAVES